MKKKIMSLLLIFVILQTTFIVSADEQLEEQKDKISSEIFTLNEEISSLEQKEEVAMTENEKIKVEITNLENQIDETTDKIASLDEEIAVLEEEINWYFDLYSKNLDALKEQLKFNYVTGPLGIVDILANSPDIYSFTQSKKAIEEIAEAGEIIIEEINLAMEQTEDERHLLVTKKEELANEKKSLELQIVELNNYYIDNEKFITQWQKDIEISSEQLDSLQQEETRVLDLIRQERIAQQENEVIASAQLDIEEDYEVIDLLWPVPGYGENSISWHYNGQSHHGLDVAANYGTPIVAASDGKVLSADFHWSWGETVLLYHDENYSTRYAHLSSYIVSSGDYVKEGQVIGYVGSTGFSTGNHLHFEVYFNDTRVNPYPYF